MGQPLLVPLLRMKDYTSDLGWTNVWSVTESRCVQVGPTTVRTAKLQALQVTAEPQSDKSKAGNQADPVLHPWAITHPWLMWKSRTLDHHFPGNNIHGTPWKMDQTGASSGHSKVINPCNYGSQEIIFNV